jgi:hypothetical protein
MSKRLLVIASSIVCLALSACDSDDSTPPASPGDGGAATASYGQIKGTVTYTGAQTGTLKLALYLPEKFPPSGPPAASFKGEKGAYTFPAAYTIKDVPAGPYKVTGFLDVNNDGNQATPGLDPVVPTQDITVVAGQDVTVDITLQDP